MVAQSSWREVHRWKDLLEARAVATCIAAMDFEARSYEGGGSCYIIEVRGTDWADLADVPPEIIDEQEEFDRRLEQSRTDRVHPRMIVIVSLTSLVELLAVLRLIEL